MTQAVVFDLWETLAAWPHEDLSPLLDAVGLEREEWTAAEHRDRRWTSTFAAYLDSLGLDAGPAARAAEIRTAMTRRALVPVDGVLPLLRELRARGLRLGLISNCSSEVGDVWEESPFAGLFDAVVLSAQVGLCKPDPRIYRIALERLEVEAEEAVFVGDGDSGELAGAEGVGMRAVQLGVRDGWAGERIDTLAAVLGLVQEVASGDAAH